MSAVLQDLARCAAAGAVLIEAHRSQPLPGELLPVEPFPMSALPEAFGPWVSTWPSACTARLTSWRCRCWWPALRWSRGMSASGRKANRLVERGNLWALIVGRPGIMKSPAMSQALAPHGAPGGPRGGGVQRRPRNIEAEDMAAKLRAEASMKAARAALKKDARRGRDGAASAEDRGEAPTRRRYVVNDLTYEKLGEILVGEPGWRAVSAR